MKLRDKMAWEAEPIQHFLEVIYVRNGKVKFSKSEEYTPGEDSTNVSFHLPKNATALIVRPYALERFKQPVEENYPDTVVNELFACIRNAVEIEYLGMTWVSKRSGRKGLEKYLFKNDEPVGVKLDFMSGPMWPIDEEPILDERLAQYFTALKDVRPSVTDSLDRCMVPLLRSF